MLFQNRYSQAVKFLCTLIPKKSSLKILEAIKVSQKKESVTFEATDLENFIRVRLPVWGDIEGEYAVDAKQLSKAPKVIATKIASERISYGNLSIPALDIKEFPSLETRFFTKPVWEQPCFSKHEFLEAGKRACNYTATDSSRGVLEGVCFRNGFFYATNGNYLLKVSIGLKAKKGFEFIVPRIFFKLISNEFVLDDQIDLSVFMADKEQGYIIARGMSFEIVSKLIPGEYPIIEKVLPKEMPYSFSIEREPFLEVVKKAVMYANKKSFLTELIPGKNGKGLMLKVEDKDGGFEYSDKIDAKPISKKKWNGVAFNAKSMSVILSDAPGRIVTLKAGESQISAITIEPQDNDKLFFLLMPLRKIEEEVKPESDEKKDEAKTAESPKSEVQKGEVQKTAVNN
jgi:DNA polymerase III sliding clamp (beta) subunit (PCNA family)